MKRNPSMNEPDTRSVPERFQGARDLNAHRLQPRRHFCEDLARQWRFRIFLAFSFVIECGSCAPGRLPSETTTLKRVGAREALRRRISRRRYQKWSRTFQDRTLHRKHRGSTPWGEDPKNEKSGAQS
jgi:hypothetical protein